MQVRSIHYISFIEPLGHYKSIEIYKLMTTYVKSILQEQVFHCLIYLGLLCSKSLFVQPLYYSYFAKSTLSKPKQLPQYNNNNKYNPNLYYKWVQMTINNTIFTRRKKFFLHISKLYYKLQYYIRSIKWII